MIPLKYNVRNLRERWVTTLMTVIPTGMVVFVTVLTFGLSDGLEHALRISGEPLDLIVMRKGSTEETSSSVTQQQAREIANLEGIARDASGQPMCSAEFVTILTKPRRGDGGTTNLIIRGLQENGRSLRPGYRIVQGRDIRPGLNELITTARMAERFQNLAIGETLEINKINFQVVGYFKASGSSAESEVWGDLRDVTGARRTPNALSAVNLRARDEAAKQALLKRIREDEQFKLDAVDEATYYERQMSASFAIKFVGVVFAAFLTMGAMFAAANTMYAAVASRSREIGALRAIGFSRRSVLTSFLLESVVLCLLGGVLGCLLVIPFNGLSTGTANWATFSEITFSFQFGPNALLRGVFMALIMGLLGGLLPAIRAVWMPIITALRET
jgi:putative ABC transport system permease protein